jgi:hypothetical protein
MRSMSKAVITQALRSPDTTAFQPRRLMIAPAADGCKRVLAAHAM